MANTKPTAGTESVRVAVRCRPMNKKELAQSCGSIVQIDCQDNALTLTKPGSGEVPKTFTYDHCYGIESTQQQVYDDCAFPLVESVLEGYNGTIFAYGQTGCGKSHTMMGNMGEEGNDDLKGIIPKTVRHIFGCIDGASGQKKFLVRCSYLEIYNESILDLLSHTQGNNKQTKEESLKIKEDPNQGIFVQDLTNVIVKSVPELEKLLNAGLKSRKVGETAMNKDSSRSHSIFTIYIETAEDDVNGEQKFKVGKLNLVDLAGSERQSKTGATGDRLKEAQKINLSLSALGNVISALVDGKSQHIPYRDSKLTRLLQDSLGGNTKTVMVAAVSPADYNYDETLSTLRYASRAKSIQNKPKINEDPKDTLLRQYEDEIKQLREMLSSMKSGVAVDPRLANQAITNHIGAHNAAHTHVEESVDELIKKLESQGKKIKIIEDNDCPDDVQQPVKNKKKQRGSVDDIAKQQQQIEEQKVQIENQLKAKDEMLLGEQEQKQQLETMLKELEQKLVVGGNVLEEKEREQAQKYRDFQLKLKKQKKKEKKLLKEKQEKEDKMLLAEKNYQSLQEEVDEQRQLIDKLRLKYMQASQEVTDIDQEHQGQKEQMLETIRDTQLDLKFYKKICKMLLKDEEIAKLKLKSNYEDDDWNVPAFVLRQQKVSLPKVNGRGIMEREKQERDMELADNGSTGESESDNGEVRSQESDTQKRQAFKTLNDGGFSSKNSTQYKRKMPKKDSLNNPSLTNLRRSNIDFMGIENSGLLVKNSKVNAQLAPLGQIGNLQVGTLPPPMSQQELKNFEKYPTNGQIENILQNDGLLRGKLSLAPLQKKK